MMSGSHSPTRSARPASAAAVSGADTGVLRIEHVGAQNAQLGALAVYRGDARQLLADALPAAREQRESHPALKLGGRSAGGNVAEALARGSGVNELRAVAQAPCRIERAHPDQLQPLAGEHSRAPRECAPDEITLLLQQVPEAEVRGAGVAVELRRRHVSFLDAQGVERIESVG